ncbi:hypothetical protein NQ314_001617 [Rhamnusium bicolor]|uniref:Transposase n=1 Tax=Rhamnusium bicolor TaxID=1586634 RepID=A0AAV8ZTS1_9CUCU|nr:hypothetical protein NQ314_001617 [Rhamnusium bicolor]
MDLIQLILETRLGFKECNKARRFLNALLKSAKSLRKKHNLATSIGQIKSFREKFRPQLITGEGHHENKRKETASCRVKWNDVDSAFNSRIRTGVVTNLKHIEPLLFLKDCKAIFQRRILNALKKY